ncbi:MAG TPA: hypothetical protein VMC86_03810 [Gemmatimonadales bacterium]|nr:hypothetical protein [Gemmatimonadales bacterium]
MKVARGILLVILAGTPARAQNALRVEIGGLELAHEYGLLLGLPLGDGPFNIEGQLGLGGAGGSLSLAWPLGPRDDRSQGVMWFVSAGAGPYFRDSDIGDPQGGVYTLIGGLRMVTGGGDRIRFASEGGLTFEAGVGFFQTTGARNPDGKRKGVAGRLAVGWTF